MVLFIGEFNVKHMTLTCRIIESGQERSEPSKVILQGLIDYNKPWFGHLQSFCINLQDDSDQVVAGINGVIDVGRREILVWQVWVNETYRGQGIGRQLMDKLEEFSKSKDCHLILLDTFEFQALAFYKKLGYQCYATVPKQMAGHDKYFLRKEV